MNFLLIFEFQFQFYNPTVLRIHPLDGDLYVLDEHFLYRIRKNFHVIELIVGRPLNCHEPNDFTALSNPIDFTFNQQGDLILLEKNAPFLRLFRSSTNRLENFIFHSNEMKRNFLAVHSFFDGSILLANLASKEIFKLKTIFSINDDEFNHGLQIHSNEKNEIFLFNRLGQHRSTIDALTGFSFDQRIVSRHRPVFVSGETIFNFTYDSPQNAYGKLESISYRNGQSLQLKYDYAMRINDIIRMPIGEKFKVNRRTFT